MSLNFLMSRSILPGAIQKSSPLCKLHPVLQLPLLKWPQQLLLLWSSPASSRLLQLLIVWQQLLLLLLLLQLLLLLDLQHPPV